MTAGERKLDDAARAAWLAYIGGLKQDEIATLMGISRQSAQRLVSQALASGLVKVTIDHPIARCMELADGLRDRFSLASCEVVPTLESPASTGRAVSVAVGNLLETYLLRPEPQIIGLGTGRTLRAAVEHLPHMDCAHHKIVSMTGNITPDGSTAYYNVLFTVADKVTAATYPLPLPVIAASTEERDALMGQKTLHVTRALSTQTDVRFVGIGTIGANAPLLIDGFISAEELSRLQGKGAVGEIIGYVYDADGAFIDDTVNARVSSAPLEAAPKMLTIGAASGAEKVPSILAALRGKLISGLITDEATAEALLH